MLESFVCGGVGFLLILCAFAEEYLKRWPTVEEIREKSREEERERWRP